MSLTMDRPSAPPLPSRHPGRQSATKSTASNGRAGIDQRNLHIWEHSVTLYHGFDWQASAENFLFLSRMIEQNVESTLCLLNAAIIFARLGEYNTASQILADAEPEGEIMSLTMFIMGHVEFELGNFEKAEDSFKVALNNLDGRSQNFSHLGLEFTLKASHIQQDLRVFASRSNLYGFLGTLGALPADGIFNSPSALSINTNQPATLKTRSSTESGYVPTLGDFSTPTSPAISPVDGYFENDKNSSWWSGSAQEPDIPVTIRHNSISEALEDVRAGFEDLRLPPKPTPPPMKSLSVTPEPSIKSRKRFGGIMRKLSVRPTNHIVTQTVDHSKHPALRARDARVHGGETDNLANFILNLPPQNQRKPRDAEVSKDSTRDLAAFLRNPADVSVQPAPAGDDDESVYSSDSNEAVGTLESVTDRELHRLADTKTAEAVVSQISRRRFRDGVASLIVHPRGDDPTRTAPASIHQRSASTSRSATPALTALPSVSTRSSSLRISPSSPFPRKLGKATPAVAAEKKAAVQKKKLANQPKMVPAEQPVNFTDFFPKFMAKRMSEW